MTDVLSDILDTVALKAAIYFRTDFRPEFGITVPAYRRAARFHLVIQGACYVALEDGRRVRLQTGDLAFVPDGAAHVLSSGETIAGTPLADVMSQVGFSGIGPFVLGDGDAVESCQMVCGHFTFADGADHPLLRAIPDLLHITAADRAARPMLDEILCLIVRRMFEGEAGATATVSRLSEILFIEAMRVGIAQAPEVGRLMSAFSDPHIGKALSLIHGDVAAPWTVESLAATVGMSRSRFAERFRDLVGSGPMAYVAEWRLQRALNLLSEGREPIKTVAHRVGYRSAAAFTRAFSERFGCSPKERRVGAKEA
jgi:AraC family transcriptional regulator, activator of mtrCDE